MVRGDRGHFLIGTHRRRRAAVLASAAVVAAAGLALELAGAAPWLALAGAVGILTLAIGQRRPWALAVALAVVAMLAGYAVLLRLSYVVPVALEYQLDFALLAVSAAGWVALWRHTEPLRLPAWHGSVALLPVVLLLSTMVIAVAVTDGTRLSWAMHSDAVWNTMVGRFVLDDHGVSPGYASAAPLTPALIAAAMASGRGFLDPSALLQHDATRAAELWLLLILASCILAGVVALSALSKLHPVVRGLGSLLIALVPLSSFAAGNAIQFGFYNATIALVLLLCAWLAWTAAPLHRLTSMITLALCVVATLATWAPLAVVPAALVAVITLGAGREWWRGLRRGRLVVFLLAVAGVAAYAAAFTLPDLLREGGSLSANGGIFALGPRQVALTAVVALAATGAAAFLLRRRRDFTGVVIVVISAGLALGYLLVQRRGLETVWGYYPAKFSWLVLLLLVVVVGASLFSLVERSRRRVTAIAVIIAASVVTVGLISYPRPLPESASAAWGALIPSMGGSGDVTTLLFSLSDPREKNLVSSSIDDGFINGWLLQQQAQGPNDTIRGFAYTLDSTDVAQLCDVAAVWGAGVVVHTPDSGLSAQLREACPAAGITAVVD